MTHDVSTVVDAAAHNGKVLERIGHLFVNAVKKLLSTPGAGEVYGNHQASAPGDPPAVDTGRLRSSYDFQTGPDYVDIGSNVEYAPYLEFGTRTIAPRPHLRRAVEENRAAAISEAVAAITAAQRAAAARLPPERVLP